MSKFYFINWNFGWPSSKLCTSKRHNPKNFENNFLLESEFFEVGYEFFFVVLQHFIITISETVVKVWYIGYSSFHDWLCHFQEYFVFQKNDDYFHRHSWAILKVLKLVKVSTMNNLIQFIISYTFFSLIKMGLIYWLFFNP